MKKIIFEDLPSTNTPLNAENLNLLQENVQVALDSVAKEFEALSETILYEDETGFCSGSISLTKSVEQSKRIKIFYRNSNNNYGSVEVYSPDRKSVDLIGTYSGSDPYFLEINVCNLVFSGDKVTFSEGRSIAFNSNKAIQSLVVSNSIYVTKIIEYDF